MSKKTAENIVSVIFLVFFVGILVASYSYGPRARLVPIPIAMASSLLVCFQLYITNSKSTKFDLMVDASELFKSSNNVKPTHEKKKKDFSPEKERAALLIVLSFLAIVLVVGLEVGIFIFVTGYFKFINKDGWLKSLIFGSGTLAAIYALFVLFLKVQMYKGLFLS